jgi:predicted glycosyltransferase
MKCQQSTPAPDCETLAPFGGVRARKLRIALYSPGMVGIGHLRRNLLIAQTLVSAGFHLDILLIAEARQVNAFEMPPGVDCLTLPALRKAADGRCQPRYLDIRLEEIRALRAQAIRAALEAFQPEVFIVDHLPRGAVRELEPSLEYLAVRGHTRFVLGLRDVLEDPETVRREWDEAANLDAILAYYDVVWVYGDAAVYDPVREYGFPTDVAAKVRYTGYLARGLQTNLAESDGAEPLPLQGETADRLALCMVGGGQDGAQLAETFAQAEFPAGMTGVIVLGPFMPPEAQQRIRGLAAGNCHLRVLKFVTDPDLLLGLADRVVMMGGYNSTCEVLAAEKHALVVPRGLPRPEQCIRAERLRNLGLIDMIPPDQLDPGALSGWLARDLGPPPPMRRRLDLNGTARLPRFLEELLMAPGPARNQPYGRRTQEWRSLSPCASVLS